MTDRLSAMIRGKKGKWGKWRTWNALFLALAFTASLVLPWLHAAAAPENLYFVAVDEAVLPLDDDTMPFWYASHLYISGEIFSNAIHKSLGVARIQNLDEGFILFFDGSKNLTFRESTGYAEDEEGNTYYPSAVLRNGNYFVPASVLADFFSFSYSVTPVEHGSLVWLRENSFRLNDRSFASAASAQLRNCYQEYLRTHPDLTASSTDSGPSAGTAARPSTGTASRPSTGTASRPSTGTASRPSTGTTSRPAADSDSAASTGEASGGNTASSGTGRGSTASPDSGSGQRQESDSSSRETVPQEEPAPEPVAAGKKTVYLCFRAGEGTEALLDTLVGQGVRASFFCGTSFVREQGSLLRRMTAAGCGIGLLADPGETGETGRTITEQLEEGNRYLERAGCGKTRLAMIENGTDSARREAAEAGYACIRPALNWSGSSLRTQAQCNALLWEIGIQDGRVPVWLDSSASAAGLEQFLTTARELEDRCLPLTETALL